MACILPARHGSQIASVRVFDARTIPVTSPFDTSLCSASTFACARRRCHSDSSRASVELIAVHSLGERGAGMVMPERCAVLCSLIGAQNSVLPLCANSMRADEMVTAKPRRLVRNSTDSRLFRSAGTCRTRVNSTSLASLPSSVGLNTTVPTPAEWTTWLSARRMGTRRGL